MKRLSNELFDKYLAGTADPEESLIAKEAIRKNPQLNRIYIISRRYRAMMDAHKKQADILPMERKAAETSDNLCDIFCERYFLRERFPVYEKKENSPEENEQNFQQNAGKDGVPLYKVGYLLDSRGLVVQRQYGASLDDLKRYLERGESVIAVIDEDILKQTELDDMLHTVCVLGLNDDNVSLYNPTSDGENNHGIETHPLESFLQAWHPSEYYLVRVSTPEETVYEPHPVDLDDVDIDEELHDLIHPIAENLHDVWSKDRLQKGIQYGPLDKKGHERPGFNHYQERSCNGPYLPRLRIQNRVCHVLLPPLRPGTASR